MKTEEKATEIVKKLVLFGHEAYFAGGAVRDKLLGKEPVDIDIATTATPERVDDAFPNVKFVGKSFGVSLVKHEGEEFEVATFRVDSDYKDGRRPNNVRFVRTLEEDAKRRDLTINAIYFEPITERYIDPTGGLDDIRNGVIRFVGNAESRIQEDYLRMLRAIRFAAQLNFELAEEDMNSIKKNVSLIYGVAPERIREEFEKAFKSESSARFISLLWSSELLTHILPEVSVLQLTEQDPRHHPEGDALTHTIRTLKLMPDASVNLTWGALLHDIGKATTTVVEEDGRITSKGHDKVSKNLAENILDRLKFSNEDKEHILFLVENHMKPIFAKKMRLSKVKKLVFSRHIEDLIKLAICDAFSTGKNYEDIGMEGVHRLQAVLEEPPESSKPEPILKGRDLIKLGFKPGPIFKEILDYIYDAQLDGKINTTDEAKEIVNVKWKKQSRKED